MAFLARVATLGRSYLGSNLMNRFSRSRTRPKDNMVFGFMTCNFLSTHRLTKNIELITEDDNTIVEKETKKVISKPQNRPLLVLLPWLMSQPKHVMKFANFYLEQGFDVVTVSITPWQLLWPAKGTRIVANDLVQFLHKNKSYETILLHGFSVGGYMWGEVSTFLDEDLKKYDHIIQRIVGHIWDSAADISELTIGAPKAVFPHNEMLENLMRKYMEYHMQKFHNQATQYYIRSSQLFHQNLVRSPGLMIMSKTDPVGSVKSNMRVRDSWVSRGTTVYIKLFENSPHCGHFYKHPKEYVAELYSFLHKLQLIQNEEKIRQRL